MTTIKEPPALPPAPPLHYDPSRNLLRGWVTLSATSIRATLISPLVGRAKGPFAYLIYIYIYIFLSLYLFCLSAALGAFRVWIPLLTNKFVWSQLSSSPRGGLSSLSDILSIFPADCFHSVFTCVHLIPLRTFTQGEICNFKSRNRPFFLSPLFPTASNLFLIKGYLPGFILSACSYFSLYFHNCLCWSISCLKFFTLFW